MFAIYVENRSIEGALSFARIERVRWLDLQVAEAFILGERSKVATQLW